jgi:shikimate kinase
MHWINTHGCSIYFDVSVETLLRRAAQSKKPRPILTGKTEEERAAYIQQQLDARMPYYKKAHIIFPADKPDLNQLAELISASH